jgi:hypothetical protein
VTINRLVFDVTDADTRTASANTGAWVRAGTDGDLIGSQTVAASEWLQAASALFDGAGTALTSTLLSGKQSLDVNVANASIAVTATNLDVRDLLHTQDSVRLGDGTSFYTSTTVGPDIGLDVNIINAAITTSDAALANTAVSHEANSIGFAAEEDLVTAPLAARKYLFTYNNGNKPVYLGTTGVTTATGFPMAPGVGLEFRIGAAIDLQAISLTSAQDVRNLQFS